MMHLASGMIGGLIEGYETLSKFVAMVCLTLACLSGVSVEVRSCQPFFKPPATNAFPSQSAP